jgi:predicted RNA-binding protein YlxR (DUF448 family)
VTVHVPVRTCVGCAQRDGQPALVRFVAGAEGLVLDRPPRAPGRGAYLHPRPECWTLFARRRGPVRSLRRSPTPAERERFVASLAVNMGRE